MCLEFSQASLAICPTSVGGVGYDATLLYSPMNTATFPFSKRMIYYLVFAVCWPERVFEQSLWIGSKVHKPIWRIHLWVPSWSQRRPVHWMWSCRPLPVKPMWAQCKMSQRRRNLQVSFIFEGSQNQITSYFQMRMSTGIWRQPTTTVSRWDKMSL